MTGQRSFRMGWFTARSGKKGWRTETGERLFGKPARNASKAYAAQGGNANRGVGRRLRDSDSDDGSVVSDQSGDEVVDTPEEHPLGVVVLNEEGSRVTVLPPITTANILPSGSVRRRGRNSDEDSDDDDGSVVSGQSGDEVVFHSDADPPPPDFVVFDEDAGVPVLPPVSTANILPDRRRPYYEEEEEHEVIVIDD